MPVLLSSVEPRRRARGERLIELALRGAAAVAVVAVLAILVFLLCFALPLASGGRLASLFSWRWQPTPGGSGQFGILTMVAGSLYLGVSAMLLAWPLALGVCLFAHGIGPAGAARPLLAALRAMTSVPTVVYGLVSAFLLVPAIRAAFGGSGFCWLAALLTLALLVLPTIALFIDQQLTQASAQIHLSAAALGLSRVQELWHLTLPLAGRGLYAAAALGFARAVGDTLVALMLAGNAVALPHSLVDPLRTLTAHIALVVATDSQSVAYHALFACGVILFVFSLAMNLALHWLRALGRRGHEA